MRVEVAIKVDGRRRPELKAPRLRRGMPIATVQDVRAHGELLERISPRYKRAFKL